MSDIIISGYYGLGNSGDEALLESIVKDLKSLSPDITITALSGNARLTNKRYGIKTVSRMNLFSIIKEMRKAKLLLSGGGTLIQDATSTKSLLYYLFIISLARKMGLKTMIYANGMGPVKEKNIEKVKKVLNETDLITLRENISLEELKKWGVDKPQIIVTADPAFNLVPSDKERAEEILSEYAVEKEEKVVSVSVRKCNNLPRNFEEEMALALDVIAEMGYLPVFIPMQLGQDLELSINIAKRMKNPSRVIDREIMVGDMLSIIGRCSFVCGMRLHMLIFASVMNVPMAGIAYDPKIKGFMDYMSQKNYIDLENFSGEEFSKTAINCIENEKLLREQLKNNSVILREKARKNAPLALGLIEE